MPPKPRARSEGSEGSRSKGEASRLSILLTAAKLATTKGLDGLSIGELAEAVGMSKSGLYAHFQSKEELELATIETAASIFEVEVLRPAMEAPAGVRRVRALVDSFLGHLERRVFPGGCFFAAVSMELDTRPGRARDRVVEMLRMWMSLLRQCFLDAKSAGEIDAAVDEAQAAFEIEAMLLAGNFLFILTHSPTPLNQARNGVESVLARSAVGPVAGEKGTRPGQS